MIQFHRSFHEFLQKSQRIIPISVLDHIAVNPRFGVDDVLAWGIEYQIVLRLLHGDARANKNKIY